MFENLSDIDVKTLAKFGRDVFGAVNSVFESPEPTVGIGGVFADVLLSVS